MGDLRLLGLVSEAELTREDWGGGGKRIGLTRIHPLHAIGECVVCDEVIASPAGIGDDGVCGG